MLSIDDEIDFLFSDEHVATPSTYQPPRIVDAESLEEEGYEIVGEGHFGIVFVRGAIALKIYSTADIAYSQWLSKIPTFGGAYPVIHEASRSITYSRNGNIYDAYAVEMEVLEPCSLEIIYMADRIRGFLRSISPYDSEYRKINFAEICPELGHDMHEALAFARDIAHASLEESLRGGSDPIQLDIRGDNIMIRPSTRDLVLTDPLV